MPAGQNSNVEAIGAQSLPRGYGLLSFDLVLFTANDMNRSMIYASVAAWINAVSVNCRNRFTFECSIS